LKTDIRYISKTHSGKLKESVLTSDDVISVVIHKKYFMPQGLYLKNSRDYDIALIKVVPNAQFAGYLDLPTHHQSEYSSERLNGILLAHGIGRERGISNDQLYPDLGDGVKNFKTHDQPQTNSTHVVHTPKTNSYYGGSVQVATEKPQELKDQEEQFHLMSHDATIALFKHFKEIRDNPTTLEAVMLSQKERKETKQSSHNNFVCLQKSFKKSQEHLFTFSKDNKASIDANGPHRVLDEFVQAVSTGSKLSDDDVKSYAERLGQAKTTSIKSWFIHQNKWHFTITSGPEENSVIKICKGDYGGPVVQSSYVPGGTKKSVLVGMLSNALINSSSSSACAQYATAVSTFPHLNWITAVKTSVQAGNHSFQKYRQLLLQPSKPN